jgi:glycosyltransferase involved in cell wall biosynthesis
MVVAVSAPMAMNGVSRHAANLAGSLLQASGISRVHFVAGEWQKEMFRDMCDGADARFHAHYVAPGDGNLSRLSWYFRELPHIVDQLKPDVIHYACPAPIPARISRCTTVVSLHDLYPFDIPENFGRFRSSITRAIMRQCLRSVDGIACVSESTRNRLQIWFPELAEKAETIHNVVTAVRRPPESVPGKFADEPPFVLCVAQHRLNKNVPLAIRIFERLLRYRMLPRNAQLLVVGIEGPQTRAIRNEIKETRLERQVVLLSGLSDAELYRCYDECLLLLAPSSTEGFGLPVAEATLRGCPVVCSDIAPFREIGGNACRYVGWGEGILKRYTEAVAEVLRMPRPEPVPLIRFSSRTIGKKYAAFYRRLTCPVVSTFWYATATNPSPTDEKQQGGNVTGLSFQTQIDWPKKQSGRE